jgi:hypothetical protein
MHTTSRRALLVLAALVVPFVALRLYLHRWPDTDLNVGPYNVHHLYTGVLLMTLGGVPLALFRGTSRLLDAAAVVFGIGLSLALDEWVYLIATDGTNASYLLPVSLWGAVTMIGFACGYAVALWVAGRRRGEG